MANELTVSASINYSKNNHQLTFSPTAQQIDLGWRYGLHWDARSYFVGRHVRI